MYDFDTDTVIIQVENSPAFAGDVKIKFKSSNKVSPSPADMLPFSTYEFGSILFHFVLKIHEQKKLLVVDTREYFAHNC